MDTGNTKNNGNNVVTILLLLVVIALAGYIGYDKIQNGNTNCKINDTQTQEKKNEDKQENKQEDKKEETKEQVRGACPFTKFDKNYVLTTEDKEDIINDLSNREAFKLITFVKDSPKTGNVSNSGYLLFTSIEDNHNGLSAIVYKVNGKMKVITAGTGFTTEQIKFYDEVFNSICN